MKRIIERKELELTKLNSNNITNRDYLFNEFESLLSLPDISKQNTNNITYIEYFFDGCESLLSLLDISNWNKNNVTKIYFMNVNLFHFYLIFQND